MTKWGKHQTLKDARRLSWLKLDVNIFNDPKLFKLKSTEKLVYIYLLTLCAQSNSSVVTVNIKFCSVLLASKNQHVINAIRELEQIQVITIIPLNIKREQNITKYNKTEESRVTEKINFPEPPFKKFQKIEKIEKNVEKNGVLTKGLLSDKNDSSFRPSEILDGKTPESLADKIPEIWNENSGKLPKVENPVSPIRQQKIKSAIKNHPEEKTWVEAIKRISESDFANGLNERSWVATFNWLIQPESIDKIIDGTYDNRRNLNKQEIQKIKTLRMGNPFTGKENDK